MNINWSLALLALGACVGVMVYVSAVIAPLVFTVLTDEDSGALMRAQFRRYYLFLGALAAFAAVMLIESRPLPGAFAAVSATGFLLLRQVLLPQMEEARAARERDDLHGNLQFARLHRMSLLVNVLQFAALIAAALLVVFGR